MTRPLYDLPPAQPMNARLWTGEVPSTPITPVSEVGNAATARDVSSAIAGAPLTGMLIREDLRVPKEETTMPRGQKAPDLDERREKLRAYLTENGATNRKALADALGYGSDKVAIQRLNDDLDAIGAAPTKRFGREVALVAPAKRPKAAPVEKPVVRPTLFAAVREAIREANATGAALELEPAFVSALHLRLVEAGL